MTPTNTAPVSVSAEKGHRPPPPTRARTLWLVAAWVLTCASVLLGLVVLGTAALMTGDGNAILDGFVLWAVSVTLSIIGVRGVVRRSATALAALPLAAPCVLALLIARFVLGVET
jgi:hypothetical protein